MALLEAPYVRDTNMSVGQHIKEQVAIIGENIQVCLPTCERALLHLKQPGLQLLGCTGPGCGL